jgi:hypothetical protein
MPTKKKLVTIGIGLLALRGAAAAPVIPTEEKPVVWYVREEGCFMRFADGSEEAMDCEEYWKTANTPRYPQPKRVVGRSLLSRTTGEANAAIAFDAVSNSGGLTNTSSFSWSHTSTGSDLVLTVGVSTRENTSGSTNGKVTGVTYNSVAMTEGQTDLRDTASSNRIYTQLWYLAGPATGENTVSVTLTATTDEAKAGAMSFTGVDQTTPKDASNGTNGSGTTPSIAVTTVADNA